MRVRSTPLQHWLSLRVRLTCAGLFVLSLFLPPYVPPPSHAATDPFAAETGYFLLEEGFLVKSSSLTEQGTRLAFAEAIIHTVAEGESLGAISGLYGISTDTIRWANDLEEGTSIQPGQELIILPVDGVLHTVTRGQNLSRIAELYDVSLSEIRATNKLGEGYLLAGQELIIPGGRPVIPAPTVAIAQQIPTPTEQAVIDRSLDEKPLSVRRQLYEPPPSVGIMQKPCDCYVTQYFNGRHFALDMQRRDGNGGFGGPIFAAEAGTVLRAESGWNGGYGTVIEVDHGNGLVTVYAHNKTLHVAAGDAITRGQHIADMGRTGLVYGATGIHLHFEVRVNGVKKNPVLYLE